MVLQYYVCCTWATRVQVTWLPNPITTWISLSYYYARAKHVILIRNKGNRLYPCRPLPGRPFTICGCTGMILNGEGTSNWLWYGYSLVSVLSYRSIQYGRLIAACFQIKLFCSRIQCFQCFQYFQCFILYFE